MTDPTDDNDPRSSDPQRDSAQAVASGLASLNRIFGSAPPAAEHGATGAASPTIRPLSVEAARRALGEASATLADTESKLIEVEAKREKLLAKQADAQRRRDRALEALRSIHADELLDGPAPHAVENGHLEGVS